jgi:cellulose synthase/poly-beta-1,6-N-acetylglucosamine synthase-like glycosyltransferase
VDRAADVTDALWAVALVAGVTVLVSAAIRLVQVPFAFLHEAGQRRSHDRRSFLDGTIFTTAPLVSVIVPAYNEQVVIGNCLRSIARSDYPSFEIICVDDGSTDGTFDELCRLAAELPGVTVLRQQNAGKGAALNTGITAAHGEVLLLGDADGVFRTETITEMVRGFEDATVGGVCGDDRPVNLDRVQTRFLALIGHVGTGLLRRALSTLRCLPVVSGNTGAFRREVLDRTGLLRTDTLGEDLELTWRVYRAGFRVTFAPRALVRAESPSTVSGLWRQRVRWARGLLQAMRLHGDMIGNLRHGPFGVYLVFNTLSQVVAPAAQVVGVAALMTLEAVGVRDALPVGVHGALPVGFWAWLAFVGLPLSLAYLALAVILDRALGDLRYAWTLPLWPVYSAFMSLVMLWAAVLELRGAENRWNKLERTGTVSVDPAE